METSQTQKYVGKSGEQTPSEYEEPEGVKVGAAIEEGIVGELTWEELGIIDGLQTNEEALEVNWFV